MKTDDEKVRRVFSRLEAEDGFLIVDMCEDDETGECGWQARMGPIFGEMKPTAIEAMLSLDERLLSVKEIPFESLNKLEARDGN